MRQFVALVSGFLCLCCMSCNRIHQESDVVSKQYIHRYGYAVSQDEFQEGNYPGQVVSVLKSGVTITSTYENGVLHGVTTHTFPHSQIVEMCLLYNQGNLVKQSIYDCNALPIREEVHLSPTRYSLSRWYEDGTPLSIEEYADTGKELVEGQYFSRQNEIESRVEKGKGIRVVRDPTGLLKAREQIEEGYVTKRESFYPSGTPESVAFYSCGFLHGEKRMFTEQGEPVSVREYVRGKLHGKTTFYKNGVPSVDVSYLEGLKNGLEVHYLDGEAVSQEIVWENDRRHGPSKYYVNGIAQEEYYYDGNLISDSRWNELHRLDAMIDQIGVEILR